MNRKHLFTASLLIAWSAGSFASTVATKGVVTFQGGIINAPCVAFGVVGGILLSECPDITTGKSAPGMKPVLIVSSVDHSARQGTLIATNRESNKTDTLHYVISESKWTLVSQGRYLIVLEFP
ncbi:hypothetical protein D3C85_973670 [compost metagenome]